MPLPLYTEWIASYQRAHPEVRINYQPIGSGGGVRQVLAGTVDFGASDVPMTDAELARAAGSVVHIPTAARAVAIAYAFPGELRLSGDVLARVFLGEVTSWSDPRIRELNAGVSLPSSPIAVVHRSDGSGTTAVFTAYLARASERWREEVGVGPSVRWPAGIGAKGNDGVAAQIQRLPGSIGYVDLAHAVHGSLRVALLETETGRFVAPSVESAAAAARSFEPRAPGDLRLDPTGKSDAGAYPITSFTYVLVRTDRRAMRRRGQVADFLWWATHEGQSRCGELHYAPLPPPIVRHVEEALRALGAGDGR